MGERRSLSFFLSALQALTLLTAITSAYSAAAETIEVAPGVRVTVRTYSAPINEQPFFGFAARTDAEREADDNFLNGLMETVGTREKALDETIKLGWQALSAGKVAEAAHRFNQAYLIAPDQSVVYHGFAAIAQIRFNDLGFAEELFQIAIKQPNPLKTVNADYGRLLLIARKPAQALPVLEQAVKDTPDFGGAWTNLAWARLMTGDRDGVCAAVEEATKQQLSPSASSDLVKLKNSGQCK